MISDTLIPPPTNPFLIYPAIIVGKTQESPDILSLRLQFEDSEMRETFRFKAGQFNMLYVFGVGEVAISIVSDPDEPEFLDHTIRVVGRVTNVIGHMDIGDTLGIRGPFGKGWPMEEAKGKDVVVITGGLGCAPVVGAIEYMFRRREEYGAIKIIHGVKTPHDLLFRERFDQWRRHPNTDVLLASDEPGKTWHYHVGVVTELFDEVEVHPDKAIVMMCGPEIMMRVAVNMLSHRGLRPDGMYVSLERHMECGIGLCGHCQMGPFFLCKDGPVMRLDTILPFLGKSGV
ncbi:FAD/NAD(P)-binding protein [Candidatus Nitronereus thalassa]|uniref:FAD/NAD(P)-binding protein n=1 Tax=Candidatus Nitronereus thalassa TaxID=3020898 RepID=A0ABU3K8Z2_9BACT|nr:FAD/NAD(P)-binding protein [Candidatus Nitronereus thalassa]MDT7042832.1 FAD/NAD(P)-binding protein [Candidatus Nitronereus thalassa]